MPKAFVPSRAHSIGVVECLEGSCRDRIEIARPNGDQHHSRPREPIFQSSESAF